MTDPVCEVGEPYRSACQEQPMYAEYEGKRYCVLHYPNKEKAAHPDRPFQLAVARKVEAKDFNFAGVYFPEYLDDFASLVFDKKANFSRATFRGGVDFSNATFISNANFQRATFCGRALFSNAKFLYQDSRDNYSVPTADFSGTTYLDLAEFSKGILFEGGARFDGATFEKRAEFYGSTFKRAAQFAIPGPRGREKDAATFKGPLKFYLSKVENAYFYQAKFEKDADFAKSTFTDAVFENATFNGYTKFTEATFYTSPGKKTDFRRASFKGELYCKEATFQWDTDFYRTRFLDAVKFVGSEMEEGQEANKMFALEGHVSFTRAGIEKPKRFSFDTVLLRPSWFVGVDAREFDFTDVKWYGMPGGPEGTIDGEIAALTKTYGESAHTLLAQACRRLSANAEDNREYPLANEFHYWSMDAVRKRDWSFFKDKTWRDLLKRERWPAIARHFGLITTLYWALSGYGVRAARAFWILVAIWAAFTILYVLVGPSEFKDFGQGLGYRWQAAVYSLLALVRLNPEPRPEEPGVFQFLVGLEGILGPLQIALLALAVRRKVMR